MILEVKNLSVSISNHPLVRNLNFSIDEGETLALVGQSGSGKSLTALALMDLLDGATRSGTIHFKGKRMGMIFQQVMSALNPTLSIGNQILEGLRYHKGGTKKDVKELLTLVGIDPTRSHYFPHQFSGGQKQRIMIAIALACDPQLLICDEPTTALDRETEVQIVTLLKEIQQKKKLALLFITHDLKLVADLADRTALIEKGEIIAQGKTEEILKTQPPSPPHTYTFPPFSPPHFEFQNVSLAYSNQNILNSLSLTLHKGEVLGLMGKSGSGKSTVAKLMVRLLAPTSGTLLLNGKPLTTLSRKELAKQVQIIFQDPYASLNPRMTIGDSIAEGIDILEQGENREKRARELLFQVGLNPEYATHYPYQFSGGQRQRVGIARALATNPQLLICDEPLSSLDADTQKQILALLKKIQQERALTVLFISHDLEIVEAFAHRIEKIGDTHEF